MQGTVMLYNLNDGKYTIEFNEDPTQFRFKALRYREPWRDLEGDGLVLSMFHRIQELEEQLAEKERKLEETDWLLNPEVRY